MANKLHRSNAIFHYRMNELKQIYSSHFKHEHFPKSLLLSILFLIASLVINFYAASYALEKASNSVTDIVLSNIPVYNVGWIFVYSLWIFWIGVFLFGIFKPYRAPFVIKSTALFLIIRAIFISLTHVGPFPTEAIITSTRMIKDFTSGADLFFSAHTGEPFLLALIFWDYKVLRYFFVFISIFLGVVVLLGHLHYSIDVLSAFFITYTIYHIAEVIFKKDKEMFEKGIESK